jgi:hypothetical protein
MPTSLVVAGSVSVPSGNNLAANARNAAQFKSENDVQLTEYKIS